MLTWLGDSAESREASELMEEDGETGSILVWTSVGWWDETKSWRSIHTWPALWLCFCPAATSNQLPVPDTVRGPSPDLGPVLGSSPDVSPGLKLNFSFTHIVNKYLSSTYYVPDARRQQPRKKQVPCPPPWTLQSSRQDGVWARK